MPLTRPPAIALAFALLVGCATPGVDETSQSSPVAEAVPLPQAFAGASRMRAGSFRPVAVFPGKVPKVQVNGENLFGVPLILDASAPQILIVRSHVTRVADGSHVLFYPVISLLDEGFQVVQTLKPRYEFALEGRTLTNEFTLPPGTARVLVHTDPRIIKEMGGGSAFTGSASTDARLRGVAAALGGVLGALLVHGLTSGQSIDFVLADVGVVDIELK